MSAPAEYDTELSERIRGALSGLAPSGRSALGSILEELERLERQVRARVVEPGERDRQLAFLGRGSTGEGGSGLVRDPARRALSDMLDLSQRLDRTAEPDEGLAISEHVLRRAHGLARTVEGILAALDPADLLAESFGHLLGLLSRLVRNALARLRAFAARLGITSVSVTFASLPPELSVTLSFGTG